MFALFGKMFLSINNFINLILSKYDNSIIFKIIYFGFNKSGRFLVYILHNENMVSIDNSLKGIYNTLMNNNEIKNFGTKKVIIVSSLINDTEFNYHHNVLITNETTFDDYYKAVKDIVVML